MKNPFSKMHTTIRLTVVTVFIIATALTAGVATGLQYYFGQSMAKKAASNLYASASSGIAAELRSVGRINANVIDLLADNAALADPGKQEDHLEIFTRILRKNPLYYGVYLGREDGSFFEVINLDTSGQARRALSALPTDRWVIITVQQGEHGAQRKYQYLDKNLVVRVSRSEQTDFDVSSRPWYVNAMASDSVQSTDTYLFAQLGVPGRTISRRVTGANTVVAVDMTLSAMSEFLSQYKISEYSDIYLYSGDGQIVASSLEHQFAQTVPSRLLVDIAAKPELHGQLFETRVGNQAYLAYSAPTAPPDKHPLYVGILSPLDTVIDPFLDKVKLSILITVAFLLLLMPLSWFFANPIVYPIRQLAAENDKVRRREYDEVTRIRSSVKELDELSESMVNMVASIQAHELAQRKLMDSFIQLIAQAIDDKSAYTGGHCERVPELALMLADHASRSDLPAFREFHLDSDDEWREYRIAAWLHDCGKITIPEHIVDKGSKLETIYNRIHEVRMRFEVLWRDAEIIYWERMSESPQEQEKLASELKERQQQLRDEFNFVAECNVGGEFFDEEKQAKLREIAQHTWQRHFDNRVGLSPVEELQIPAEKTELPATELLLSDKPEHIIKRTRSTDYPSEFGINMDIPEHLYNQGELYNLSIARGTLTNEDRFKINEHMISTIKMLESLPFPEELKNVPRYASTHHETMKGSGYPRKLPGDQLSIPERILAVADVFEALTASDRPYKKAKPVSVAVDILHKMVLDNHLDKDCFELFIRDKVYLQYAQQFLSAEQIDEVDTTKYFQENG